MRAHQRPCLRVRSTMMAVGSQGDGLQLKRVIYVEQLGQRVVCAEQLVQRVVCVEQFVRSEAHRPMSAQLLSCINLNHF